MSNKVYRSRRATIVYPYPRWYRLVCQDVRHRSLGICEIDGCKHLAEQFHHLVYPVGRRERASDLQHLCKWHHLIAHHPAANDNFDLDQYEFELDDDEKDTG
jgi:hypothetical protein